MSIRLKLLKNWGGYKKGSVIDFGESKGRPLIANDTATEVGKKVKIIHIKIDSSGGDLIRVKLIKKWGGFGEGSILDLGESKGRTLIEYGMAIEVSKKEKKVVKNFKKKKPKVEIAMIEPEAETAEVTPEKKSKKSKKQGDK